MVHLQVVIGSVLDIDLQAGLVEISDEGNIAFLDFDVKWEEEDVLGVESALSYARRHLLEAPL